MTGPITASENWEMNRKHVFAVNGEADFLGLLAHFLQDENFNVTTTNYVPKTFDMINVLLPDLLILDLDLRRQAPWELLERLHLEAGTRGIPVLVTSTDRRLLDRASAEAARYGNQRSLQKPLDLAELVDAVTALTA